MNKLTFFCACLCFCFFISCDDEEPNPNNNSNTEQTRLSISSLSLFEGNENTVFTFKVTTSQDFTEDIRVDFALEEGTAGKGIDFVDQSGTLVIPAGTRDANIEVEIVTDDLKEQDEDFKIVLSNPINAIIANGEGIGTIRNDDTKVIVPEDGYLTPEEYTGYTRVWQDEFNGISINTNNWAHEIGTGNGGWGNNESQYYTSRSANSYLSDGNLVIVAEKEAYQGSAYTSARMITKNKQEFEYGRVDIRAILPEGQGIWPALWMLGGNIDDGIGWPACGEIDIMELIGHEPSTVHGTAHWGPSGPTSTYQGTHYNLTDNTKFSEEYHVFSIIWEPNSIKWLVDDNQYHSITDANINGNYPFNNAFFFIFNIAVGGNWPQYPDNTTQFPQTMYVDYIRVFQEN